jgi:hypothetical protein
MARMTDHAQVRTKQRGIPIPIVDLLLEFGSVVHDHRKGKIVFFDAASRRRVLRTKGKAFLRRIDGRLDCYAVIGSDGAVVTVGHRHKRIVRDP